MDVSERQNAAHHFVDRHDALACLGLFFTLQRGQADRYDNVRPAPEHQVAAESHDALVAWCCPEEFVGKVGAVEGEEYSV